MDIFLIILFLFGLVIGSFLNVVIYRFNTNQGLGGRSYCFTCARILTWVELTPILSYVVQWGKCRKCKSHISMQYPLVELITGLTFLGIGVYVFSGATTFTYSFSFNEIFSFLYLAVLFSLLIVIAVYDLRHKIIPNAFVYAFIALSAGWMLISHYILGTVSLSLQDALIGPIFFVLFALVWLVSKGRWMGLGDPKLMLGIGFLLGFEQGIAALLISFWIAAVISIALLFLQKRYFTLKSEIPLAPFLVLGTMLVFFFGVTYTQIINSFTLFVL